MRLVDDLMWLSNEWVEEQQRANDKVSLKTLSSRATNDGKLFTRIAEGRPISLATFETCLNYLAQGRNWPTGVVPAAVLQRLAALGADIGRHSVEPAGAPAEAYRSTAQA